MSPGISLDLEINGIKLKLNEEMSLDLEINGVEFAFMRRL